MRSSWLRLLRGQLVRKQPDPVIPIQRGHQPLAKRKKASSRKFSPFLMPRILLIYSPGRVNTDDVHRPTQMQSQTSRQPGRLTVRALTLWMSIASFSLSMRSPMWVLAWTLLSSVSSASTKHTTSSRCRFKSSPFLLHILTSPASMLSWHTLAGGWTLKFTLSRSSALSLPSSLPPYSWLLPDSGHPTRHWPRDSSITVNTW